MSPTRLRVPSHDPQLSRARTRGGLHMLAPLTLTDREREREFGILNPLHPLRVPRGVCETFLALLLGTLNPRESLNHWRLGEEDAA